jgi:hypothetical protein
MCAHEPVGKIGDVRGVWVKTGWQQQGGNTMHAL